MPDLTFKLVLVTNDASVKLAEVKQEAESAQFCGGEITSVTGLQVLCQKH